MPRRTIRRGPARLLGVRRRTKLLVMAAAALPLCQVTCYPDVLGAFSFELQRLIDSTLINALDVVVRNVLRL